MDIQAFKVFLAVVDSGSFSKAAQNLGYTPAGISYIINSLEEELEIRLIERDYSGVRPNSNGMALLQDIRRIIDSYDSFESNLRARKDRRYDTLRIASIDTMSILWLPDTVAAFQSECPHVHVEISTGDPFEINAWLAEDLFDIGLTERAWASPRYAWHSLAEDPYFAVFPQESNIPNPCPIQFFKDRDFFIPDCRRDRNISILLTRAGVKTNNLYDSANTQTIVRSITAGRGCSILSALALDLFGGDPAGLPLIAPLTPCASRELGVSFKTERNENPLIRTFLRFLNHTVRQKPIQNPEKAYRKPATGRFSAY